MWVNSLTALRSLLRAATVAAMPSETTQEFGTGFYLRFRGSSGFILRARIAVMAELPRPNLQGNYRGSCVVCMRGTDTALAFTGPAEWHLAGLVGLGVPEGEAEATYRSGLRDSGWVGADDEVPSASFTRGFRVCAECVNNSRANFPAPGHPAFGVPNIIAQEP